MSFTCTTLSTSWNLSPKELRQRLRAAFQLCEQEQQAGRLQLRLRATWDGLRVPPGQPGHLSLAELVEIAEEVAGPQHHFCVIQLPLSAKLSEAALSATQVVAGKAMTLLEAAQRLQIAVVTSGPRPQGKLVQRPLPPKFCDRLPDLTRDSHRLLQFARSAPGVAAVLCGSKERRHALENLCHSDGPAAVRSRISGPLWRRRQLTQAQDRAARARPRRCGSASSAQSVDTCAKSWSCGPLLPERRSSSS